MLPLRQSQASVKVCDVVLGVVVEDEAGRVLACNPAARRILGEDPAGAGLTAIHADGWPLPPDERPAALALASGEPCTGVTMGVRRDGGVRWLAVDAHPLFQNGGGSPYGVVVSYADVTETRAG